MILTIYQYHRRRTAKKFQSRIELDALAHRHIIICRAVNKQQRSMNLVGIIERTLIYKEMLVGPRIFVRHRNFAVAVAPIALTPIAGVVADACMRDGSCKEVGLGLKILGHESAVACADAAYLLAVYESMLIAESLSAGDDVFSHSLACRIYMAGREFLTESGGSTRIHNQHYIAHRCINMMRITALEHAARRTASAIIVHYHRILLRCIKMRWQIVTAAKGVAS